MRVELGSVANIVMGQAPAGDTYNDKGFGLPLIAGAGDFQEGRVVPKKFTTKPTKIVQPGEIILSIRASIGARVRNERESCLGRGVAAVIPDPHRLDGAYLWHWLGSARGALSDKGRGATFLQVSKADVAELEIPLPSLSEQRRIGAILDQADELRVERRRALDLLDELGRSLFASRFDVPRESVRLAELPRLGHFAVQITDGEHQTPKRTSQGKKLLSARNIQDGYLDLRNVDFVGEDEYERISRRCKPRYGDVLISCSGSVGRVAAVTTHEPFVLVRSVALIRPSEKLLPTYLEWFLRSEPIQEEIRKSARSSAQANLFQAPIRALPILVPPLRDQREFSDGIDRIQAARQQYKQYLVLLDELFASLQHRAFNGEL